MIEIIASGPVEIVEDVNVQRQDGHDPIRGSVRTTRRLDVRVDLELPQGHVNLEGFATSATSAAFAREIIERYVGEAVEPPDHGGGLRVDADAWEIELWGEWWDWIQQAHRYQVERPDLSIVDCLHRFRRWDETPSDTISRASVEAREATDLADIAVGDLDDQEYKRLTAELQEHHRYLFDTIKSSYAKQRPA